MSTLTEPKLAVPRLLESLARQTFTEFQVHGVSTRFVGRKSEIEALYEAARAASLDGTLHQIRLVGKEGVGKTRLCHELAQILAGTGRPVGYHEAHAHDGCTSAAVLLAQILRRRFQVSPGDGDDEIKHKLSEGLRAVIRPKRLPEAVGLLGSLIGLAIPASLLRRGIPHPAAFRQRALRVFATVLEHDAASAPQVLVLDGLQWLDPLQRHLIAEFLRELQDSPVLAVLVSREPIETPPAMEGVWTLDLRLGPLSKADSMELLTTMLGASKPKEKEALGPIVEAADGNPQRVVELVRLLIRRDVIHVGDGRLSIHPERFGDTRLPTDPWMAASARLEDLERGALEVLTAASVFGTHFWFDGVLSLLWAGPRGERQDLPDEDRIENALHKTLLDLMQQDVVRYVHNSQVQGSVELTFSSMHERRALFDRIPDDEVQRWLMRAGRWMLHAPPSEPRAWYRRAAELLDSAALPYEAALAWIETAEASTRAMQNEEALAAYEAAEQRVDSERADVMKRIYAGRAQVYEQLDELSASLENWNLVFRCARILSDRPLAARTLLAQGHLLRLLGKYVDAAATLDRAAVAHEELSMLDGRARVESELGMLAADRGEHAQAIKHLRRGLAMWRSVGDPGAKARCMLDMAKIYISQVELARAQPLVDEAVMLFKSTGDERGHVHGLNVLGGIHLLRDEVEEAVNTWQRASHLATISGDRGSYALVNLNLAEAYLELREFTASKECAVESLEAAAEVGHPQSEAYAHHRLACILREDAALDDALVHGQEAVRASRRLRMPVLEAMATRSTAEIRSQMLQRAAAKATEIDTHAVAGVDEMFREATAQARECGDQLVLLRALDAWSTFLHEQGFGQRGEKVRVEADRIAERIKSGVSRDASEDSGGLPSLEELVAERERIERSICREPLFD